MADNKLDQGQDHTQEEIESPMLDVDAELTEKQLEGVSGGALTVNSLSFNNLSVNSLSVNSLSVNSISKKNK